MILPTVAVHHPDDPTVRMLINEIDLRDEHVLWDDEPVAVDAMRVGKGPRGKWYVWRAQERVAGPFDTQIDADLVATGL